MIDKIGLIRPILFVLRRFPSVMSSLNERIRQSFGMVSHGSICTDVTNYGIVKSDEMITLRYMSRTVPQRISMPTILLIFGWRLFFYSNEGDEPIHVHGQKGDMECKYWLDRENYALEEAYFYHLNTRDRREIRQIIFEHFMYIEQQWDDFQRRKQV